MLTAALAMLAATPLVLGGAVPTGAIAARPHPVPAPRWPASICTPSTSHRFTTTTEGDQGNIVIEPAAAGAKPAISAAAAYRHFKALYGRKITARQRRHIQVRFGLITDLSAGPASDNVLGYVPSLRRTPAWIITNCVDAKAPPEPRVPPSFRSRGPGQLTFAIADTQSAKTWDFEFLPTNSEHGRNPGETSPYQAPHPSARLTPYYSTPWRPTSLRRHGNILIRYQPKRCYTLDHVNVYAYRGKYQISVILSSGASGQCLRPAATAPYAEVSHEPQGGAITRFRHERTGRVQFDPEDA